MPSPSNEFCGARQRSHRAGLLASTGLVMLLSAGRVEAAPPIRTSDTNPVPACVTPERLTAFLRSRNPALNPRFNRIAYDYARWGEAWRVRWDYAFYQMIIETNALKFRRGNGRRGDVHENQNNFAGIGATGGGVPGDRFADVSTGVHAQIQHLVAYSGVPIRQPIAPRTAKVQDHIIALSRQLGRPVTFADLARRWAVDPNYGRSIGMIADEFMSAYCGGSTGTEAAAIPAPRPRPAQRPLLRPFPPPSGLGGPKPSEGNGLSLATPALAETLPWQTAPQRREAETEPRAAPQQARPSASMPVRTIWSRETAKSSAARAAAIPVQEPSFLGLGGTVTSDSPKEPEDRPLLPLFRIAPAMPEPSKLGGPVPPLPAAAAALPPVPAWPEARVQAAPPSASACTVIEASYGGSTTLLLSSRLEGVDRLIALTVLDGFERAMFETYARAAAPGAEIIGTYPTPDAALADARTNCPGT